MKFIISKKKKRIKIRNFYFKMSYECAGGSLKLKGVLDKKIKKKKKSKHSSKELIVPTVSKVDMNDTNSNGSDQSATSRLAANTTNAETKQVAVTRGEPPKKIAKTKAELEYERAMEKRQEEKILKRAEKSHKEHVEDYNRQLDNLSEYNDIPKVSWTK